MIDLHNHILPGVDDGAADMEESLAIARQFVSEGVVAIVATPHFDSLRGKGVTAETVLDSVSRLVEKLHGADIPLRVEAGNELFLTPDAPDLLRHGRVLCLGPSRAVLVELSLVADTRPLFLDSVLFPLQVDGYRPILAHPERYPFVDRDPGCLDELVSRGIALQLTAPALLGHYGQRTADVSQQLLKRGLYSLAASDRHHPEQHRSLSEMHRAISLIAGTVAADLLLRLHPAQVIAGVAIEPVAAQDPLAPIHRFRRKKRG